MNTLYQRFYEDLKLTGKSPRTIETYERHLQKLERYFNKPPDQINEEELRQYLLQMKDVKHYSEAFFKQAISAFRFFYWKILNKPEWQTLQKSRVQQLKMLIFQYLSKKEQAKFLTIHFEIRKRQMVCPVCGSALILLGKIPLIRGP